MKKYPLVVDDNRYTQGTLRTEREWARRGYLLREDAVSEEMYTNCHWRTALYYDKQHVYKAKKEELDKYWLPEKERARECARIRKQRKLDEIRRLELEEERELEEREAIKRIRHLAYLSNEKFDEARLVSANDTVLNWMPENKTLVVDIETTGLDFELDEIIQIVFRNLDNKIVWSSYIYPYIADLDFINKAKHIHGISLDTIKQAPRLLEVAAIIKGLLLNVKRLIGYNTKFIRDFIYRELNIDIYKANIKVVDLMTEFSYIYDDTDYYGNYIYKDLETACRYYNITVPNNPDYEDDDWEKAYWWVCHDAIDHTELILQLYNAMYN